MIRRSLKPHPLLLAERNSRRSVLGEPFFPIDTVFYVQITLPITYCYQLSQTLNLRDMNPDAEEAINAAV